MLTGRLLVRTPAPRAGVGNLFDIKGCIHLCSVFQGLHLFLGI